MVNELQVESPIFNFIFLHYLPYRMDSDIPAPYGRTVAIKPAEMTEIESFESWIKNKNQKVLVAIADLDNCNETTNRWKYVKELQKYIAVDIYGNCGNPM